MNNVLALAVMWVAGRGPDEDHPYGHHKFETLGALVIVIFLSISWFELVQGAVTRLVTGAAPLAIGNPQIGVLVGTLAINGAVAAYEARRGRELNSDILLADAAHTRADVFITIGVLSWPCWLRRPSCGSPTESWREQYRYSWTNTSSRRGDDSSGGGTDSWRT